MTQYCRRLEAIQFSAGDITIQELGNPEMTTQYKDEDFKTLLICCRVVPPSYKLVYKPHEYYSHIYHKP